MIVSFNLLEKEVTITGEWEQSYDTVVKLNRTEYSLKEVAAMELGLSILEYAETGKYPEFRKRKLT